MPMRPSIFSDLVSKDLMGPYELRDPDAAGGVVNHRPTYKHAQEDAYLYYASSVGVWVVSGLENMQAGGAACRMIVKDPALTPEAISATATWQVSDGSKWVDAPKVRPGSG